MVKLTGPQWRVLKNVAAGRHAYFGFRDGREARGGSTGPVNTLVRKGLLVYGFSVQDVIITEAGRAALADGGRDG